MSLGLRCKQVLQYVMFSIYFFQLWHTRCLRKEHSEVWIIFIIVSFWYSKASRWLGSEFELNICLMWAMWVMNFFVNFLLYVCVFLCFCFCFVLFIFVFFWGGLVLVVVLVGFCFCFDFCLFLGGGEGGGQDGFFSTFAFRTWTLTCCIEILTGFSYGICTLVTCTLWKLLIWIHLTRCWRWIY